MLQLWIKAVRLQNFKPTANTVICSDHFTEDCYLESSENRKLLNKDAVPSVFNFPEHLKVRTSSQRTPLKREFINSTDDPMTTSTSEVG